MMKYISVKMMLKNIIRITLFLVIVSLLSPDRTFSQDNNKQRIPHDPKSHNEVMDDEYVPDMRDSQERSPAYNYRLSTIVTTQVNVDANGLNIIGDAANEPSLAVDPNNSNRIAIGWRQFNTISSNFRQAGYGYTTNGGQTWTFPGVIEPGVFRSDPVLDSDIYGNFYYNSLTSAGSDFSCHLFKSHNGGTTWGNKTYAKGGDKQWMAIDLTAGPGSGNNYSYWNSSFSACPPGHFTRSTDAGVTFQDCIIVPNEPYWGTLTVDNNGVLYVGGTTGFNFRVAKSLNAQDSSQAITWTSVSVSLDGTPGFSAAPNPGGLAGQAQIAVDTSGGPYNGYVYLLCSVERNSTSDPLDVMFSRSTDGGATWSSAKKINDDPGTTAFQWFGTMSVAPNGRIDVIWLDTRDHPGTNLSALFYSNSKDGGLTFSPNQRLSEYFDPHVGWPQQNKMGDYFDMISDYTGAYLAWAGTFTGGQDVYYSYITDTTIVPVELTSFTASSAFNTVTLDWSTATEVNNHGFEIHRSADNKNWNTIAFTRGSGTISEPQQYSYSDNLSGETPSKFYYRLKQVDFNGSFEYSEIVEVSVAPSDFSLAQNYPNPFNPATTIRYSIPVSSFVTLKVYDVLGKEVAALVDEQKESGKYEIEFNASGLGTGVYFYTLRAGNFSDTKKLILVK